MARDADVGLRAGRPGLGRGVAERPNLALHADGNHQSPLGAFLTACVLVGRLTGESPAELAKYPFPEAGEDDRKFLAGVAAKVLETKPDGVKP